MKKKTLIIILVIVTVMIGVSIFLKLKDNNEDKSITQATYDIKERKYNIIGDNLYYTDKLITQKAKTDDSEIILNYYKSISNYMKQKHPGIKVYISNFNYDTLNKEKEAMFFNGYQIINNVIIEKVFFTIYMENGIVKENFSTNLNSFINKNIDTENLKSINLLKEKVSDTITENLEDMGSFIIKNEWEYYLTYSNECLCYKFNLSNGSYIVIDAETGEVKKEYFFDGRIF